MRASQSAVVGIIDGTELLWVEVTHDGDPKYISPTLLDTYNSYEAAMTLVMLGDMRILGPAPEMCDVYKKYGDDEDERTKRESMWTFTDFMEEPSIAANILDRTECGFLYLFDADTERWWFCNHTGSLLLLIRH